MVQCLELALKLGDPEVLELVIEMAEGAGCVLDAARTALDSLQQQAHKIVHTHNIIF